jgi:AraC-like DNA-binding protein
MSETASRWCTSSFSSADQYDAWNQKLNEVYGPWRVERSNAKPFHAEITHHAAQSFKVVNCVCDPCGAARSRREISSSPGETLAVQLVLSGREHFTIGSTQIVLNPGDVLIWNTTRPMSFEVVERLHKISVLMPLTRLKSWLPNSWHSADSTLLNGSAGGRVLSSFIQSMSPEFLSGNLRQGEALTEAIISVLVSALHTNSSFADPSTLRDTQLLRVKQYIDAHLDDPDLSPIMIADANRISLRYLHCLFEPEATTVLQYVIKERLLRCHRELSNPWMARRTITDIALSWGFQNATHFGRRFREQYGVSPIEFRHELRNDSAAAD